MYKIEYWEQALLDIAKLKKDEPAAYISYGVSSQGLT